MSLKNQYPNTPEVVHVGLPQFNTQSLAQSASGTGGKEPGPETPSDECKAWRASQAAVCKDLLTGNITGYISQWEGETSAEYATRQKNSVYSFVNWYEEAVGGLVDQVFAKELQLTFPDSMSQEDIAAVETFWQDVERRQREPKDGSQFARNFSENSLGFGGRQPVLVDYPIRTTPATDAAEESEQGLGPFLCPIHPWNVIEWKKDRAGNLERVRYMDSDFEDSGWGRKRISKVVVLERGEPGRFSGKQVYVYDEDEGQYLEDDAQARTFEPPVTANAEVRARFREIPIVGDPFRRPLLENVAMLNVLHYRKRTDYDVAEGIATQPMRAFLGFSDEDMAAAQFGPFRYINTPKPPTEVGIEDISFGFDTSENARKTLESIERYISVKAKDPQSQRATGEEKATIRMLDEAKKISRLQAWALGWSATMQAALQWAGAWMGQDVDRDWAEVGYIPEVFDSLDSKPTWAEFQQLVNSMIDTPRELWLWQIKEGKRYGLISDDTDTEDLVAALEAAVAGGGLDDGDGGIDDADRE